MSLSVFEIPFDNTPQQFNISLAGKEYILANRWNDADDGGWILDIADALTNTILATNIPLVAGVDCLAGLEYLGVNGKLFVFTDGDENAPPTFLNLGVESNLYFATDAVNG